MDALALCPAFQDGPSFDLGMRIGFLESRSLKYGCDLARLSGDVGLRSCAEACNTSKYITRLPSGALFFIFL